MIPKEEFASRINKVRTRMSELGLGAFISLDTVGHSGYCSQDVRYLTNFVTPISPGLLVVVVTPKRVGLCMWPNLQGCAIKAAEELPVVNDVFAFGDEYAGVIRDLGGSVKSALDVAKVTSGKIGIDGLSQVTEGQVKSMRTALSKFEIAERNNILVELRKVKSPAEWKEIRESARVADIGARAFINSIKAGGNVSASIGEGEQAARIKGSEDNFIYMSPSQEPFRWGNNIGHAARGSVYQKGGMITFEMNTTINGYFGQVARAFVLGKANAIQKSNWETGMEAQQKMVSMLKPGAIASDIFNAGSEILVKAGLKEFERRNGHGMGLTMGETFNIWRDDHAVIKPDYYVELHMNTTYQKDGMILFGGGFRVTETGCEDLHNLEYKMEI